MAVKLYRSNATVIEALLDHADKPTAATKNKLADMKAAREAKKAAK